MSDLTPANAITPVYVAGKFGQALTTPVQGAVGSGGQVQLTDGTVEFFCKLLGTSNGIDVIFAFSNGGGFICNSSGMPYASTPDGDLNGGSGLTDGNWHHVALTFDTSTQLITLWLDGNQVAQRTHGTAVIFADPIVLNAWTIAGGTAWPGALEEVRISDIARYSAPFTPPTAAFTSDAHTVSLWHFDGDLTDAGSGGSGPGPDPSGLDIVAQDSYILYSPGNWAAVDDAMQSINPGAYFRFAAMTTNQMVLHFDIAGQAMPLSTIKYRVDQGPWTQVTLAATVPLTIQTNTWAVHTVEVVFTAAAYWQPRWASQQASVKFLGVASAGAFPKQYLHNNDQAMIFGDSITEGALTLGSAVFDTTDCDASVGYAYLMRDQLGIDIGTVGFSGQAWSSGGLGGVQTFPDTWSKLWGNGPDRDFSQLAFVLINMGQNDGTNDFTSLMIGVLNGMLEQLPPNAKIGLMRPFSGNKTDNLLAAIAGCDNPSRVFWIDTTDWLGDDGTSDGTHPRGVTGQTRIAPLLESALANAGVWPPTSAWVNVNGTLKPVQFRSLTG